MELDRRRAAAKSIALNSADIHRISFENARQGSTHATLASLASNVSSAEREPNAGLNRDSARSPLCVHPDLHGLNLDLNRLSGGRLAIERDREIWLSMVRKLGLTNTGRANLLLTA